MRLRESLGWSFNFAAAVGGKCRLLLFRVSMASYYLSMRYCMLHTCVYTRMRLCRPRHSKSVNSIAPMYEAKEPQQWHQTMQAIKWPTSDQKDSRVDRLRNVAIVDLRHTSSTMGVFRGLPLSIRGTLLLPWAYLEGCHCRLEAHCFYHGRI